ncbi:MAG: site-specific integrase [Nakamurella sp.]
MNGPRPDESEAARTGFRPEVLQALWASVPTGMRLTCFGPDTVPCEYRDGLGEKRGRSTALDLAGVPEPIRTELAWCVFRIIDQGGRVDIGHMRMLARRLSDVISDLGPHAPISLIGLSALEWEHQMARSSQRRVGALPAPGTARDLRQQLRRCYRLLSVAYDPRPWWQLEAWDPSIDARIPQRLHEPHGRRACYFDRITLGWLRRGVQWSCKVSLETGALAWGTVQQRIDAAVVFDAFLADHDVPGPWLADRPDEVRALLLEFLGHVRGLRVQHLGPTHGQQLSQSRISSLLNGVEQFYLFMHDQRETAAVSLTEPGWLRLGPDHAIFFRRGEKPRRARHRSHERDVIDADAFGQIMAGVGLLGRPTVDGGLGDEQAMRILMLLARTGRRVSEICMLDHDPLLPLHQTGAGTAGDADGFVARLRYQQTKIDGAPDTILVDREIVEIIHAQQDWVRRAQTGPDAATRKYLFVAARRNRHGGRPYSDRWLRERVGELARRLNIRDSTGALVDFQRTHRFRHTKATNLLNAGVPLHVVQRYLGHVTPTMTMNYAQTLQSTAEAEFLRFRKITADARDLEIDPQDLYDMLELDRRSDRILPHGWCLLPPRQSCVKGNACLSCDKFATDATFLPDLKDQKARTERLIDERCAAFHSRTGHPMGQDNVWLAGRRQEQDALGRIIVKLEQVRLADGTVRALRGAGAAASIKATIDNKDT